MDLAKSLALKLGEIDTDIFDQEYPPEDPHVDLPDEIPSDYTPKSLAYAAKVPKYDELGLTLIIAESGASPVCLMMLVPKMDVTDGIIFANYFVRSVRPDTKDNTTLRIPDEDPGESDPTDVRLADAVESYFCGRFVVTDPAHFGIESDTRIAAKVLVLSDDAVEGALEGNALLKAIQERTPLGISPPGFIVKKKNLKQAPKKAAVRKNPSAKKTSKPATNYAALQNVVYRSLSLALTAIPKDIPPEKLSGVALFLLSGGFAGLEPTPGFPCPRFGISLHTHEDQAHWQSPPTDLAFTRWIPARWDLRDVHPKAFRGINSFLENSISLDRIHSRKHLSEIAIQAMEKARQDFPAFNHCIFVFVTSDAYSFARDVEWVGRLNSASDAQEFEALLIRHVGTEGS